MNVAQKVVLMKTNLNSVIDHDDADEKEVQAAVDELKKHIDKQWTAAKERRKVKAAAKALPR
jgi:ribosome-associated translation inhibitor RaiA